MTLEKLVRRVNTVLGTDFTAETLPRVTVRELIDADAIPRLDRAIAEARRRHRLPFTSTGRLAACYCSAV